MAASDINGSHFIYCILYVYNVKNQKSLFINDNTEAKINWKAYVFDASTPISFVCTIYNSVYIIFYHRAHIVTKQKRGQNLRNDSCSDGK